MLSFTGARAPRQITPDQACSSVLAGALEHRGPPHLQLALLQTTFSSHTWFIPMVRHLCAPWLSSTHEGDH